MKTWTHTATVLMVNAPSSSVPPRRLQKLLPSQSCATPPKITANAEARLAQSLSAVLRRRTKLSRRRSAPRKHLLNQNYVIRLTITASTGVKLALDGSSAMFLQTGKLIHKMNRTRERYAGSIAFCILGTRSSIRYSPEIRLIIAF